MEAASDNDDDGDDDDDDDDAASTNVKENKEVCDMRMKQYQDAMPMMLIIALGTTAMPSWLRRRCRRRRGRLLGLVFILFE